MHAGIDQFNWPHDPSCMVALPLSVPKSATTADKPEAEGAVKADAKVKVEVVVEEEAEVEVESNVEDVAEEGTARNDVVELSVLDMSKKDMDLVKKGAALQMLTQRAGLKHDVEGNGTCWMYAVMAALRICEHAWCTPRARRPPTKLDIQWSQALLQAMKTHFLTLTVPRPTGRNQRDGSAAQDYAMIEERLGRQNVWVPSMKKNMAVYGSESMLSLLARTLDRSIIVLDGPTMGMLRAERGEAGLRLEEKAHHVHDPQSKRLYRRLANTIGVLIHLETNPDSLVLEHVNGNHCHGMAFKGVAPDALPACLAKAKECVLQASRCVLQAGLAGP